MALTVPVHLAAHGLLVLLAALLSALVWFDAEPGAASGAGGLARGAGGFLLVLEQLHQQVELGTAGTKSHKQQR